MVKLAKYQESDVMYVYNGIQDGANVDPEAAMINGASGECPIQHKVVSSKVVTYIRR